MESSDALTSSSDVDVSGESSKVGVDEIDQLISSNTQLQMENENLKRQLARAFEITNELESLHTKNRKLNEQLLESHQKSLSFQNRLHISQQKNQEYEAKIKELESKLQGSIVNAQQSERDSRELLEKLRVLSEERDQSRSDLTNVFVAIERITGEKVENIQSVIAILTAPKGEQVEKQEPPAPVINPDDDVHRALERVCRKNKKLKNAMFTLQRDFENILEKQENAATEQIGKIMREKQSCEKEIRELKNQMKELMEKNDRHCEMSAELTSRLEQLKSDREDDISRFKQIIDGKEQRILELKEVLENPLRDNTEDMESLVRELSFRKRETEELKIKYDEVTESLAAAKKKGASMSVRNEELKKKVDLLKKHCLSVAGINENLKAELEAAHKANESLNQELANSERNYESLEAQLKAALAANTEGETELNDQKQELLQTKLTIDSLEKMFAQQRNEIEEMSQSKERMIKLIQKQNQVNLVLDQALQNECKKTKQAALRNRQLQKSNKELTDGHKMLDSGNKELSLFNEYLIPKLPERYRFEMLGIVNDQSIPVQQKVSNVIEYIVRICNTEADKASISMTELKKLEDDLIEERKKCGRQNSVISNMFNSLQSMFRDEKTLAQVGCGNDKMIELLASQCVQLDACMKEAESLAPQFMSVDFLFSGSMDDRKKLFEKIASEGWDNKTTFDMFCAQSLINIAQSKEIERMKNQSLEVSNQLDYLKNLIGSTSMEGVQECMESFALRMKDLKSVNKKLRKFKEGIEQLEEEGRSVPQLERVIEGLNEQIESLKESMRSVVADATTLQRELDVKSQQVSSLEQFNNKLTNDAAETQRKHLEEVCQYERVVDEKTREIRDLNLRLTRITADSNQQIATLQSANAELKTKMTEKTEKLKKNLALLQQKRKNAEEQYANKCSAKDRQNQEEMRKLIDAHNDYKMKVDDDTMAMKKQIMEQKELADKLSLSLTKSQKKNQQLANDITKLTMLKKSLEGQLGALREQMEREVQIARSQAVLSSMNAETKYQEAICDLKGQLSKEKMNLMTSILAEFDELDQIEDEEIDEDVFRSIMRQICDRYRGLNRRM